MIITLDQEHRYTLDGRVVPSVTGIIRAMIPQWEASEWHMNRGTVVHACAEMIALGKDFDYHPGVAGQVTACRRWFADHAPIVLHVETPVASRHGFAGKFDLVIGHNGRPVLIDWKATLTKTVRLQLGGYAVAIKETLGLTIDRGFGVELRENGTYQNGEEYELKRAGREFVDLFMKYKKEVG